MQRLTRRLALAGMAAMAISISACGAPRASRTAPPREDLSATDPRMSQIAGLLAAPPTLGRGIPNDPGVDLRAPAEPNDPVGLRQESRAAADRSPWRLDVMPYFWVPEAHGKVMTGPLEAHVDVSQAEALDRLDFGFMGHIELGGEGFGLFIDANYVHFESKDMEPVAGQVQTDVEQGIFEFGGLTRIYETPTRRGEEPAVRVDGLFAFRYTVVDLDLDAPSIGSSGSGSEGWVDPVFGARILWNASDYFHFFVRGDIGGFDTGSSSDFVWNVDGAVSFSLARWLEIAAGYRVLDYDFHDGNSFEFDVQYRGPWLGLILRF